MRTSGKSTSEDAEAMDRLASALAAQHQAGEILRILAELLSPAERLGIARRWRLLELLANGKSHREIAARLRLSLGTVSRGSRELQQPGSALKSLMDRAQKSDT